MPIGLLHWLQWSELSEDSEEEEEKEEKREGGRTLVTVCVWKGGRERRKRERESYSQFHSRPSLSTQSFGPQLEPALTELVVDESSIVDDEVGEAVGV